jgi:hypothetical protein
LPEATGLAFILLLSPRRASMSPNGEPAGRQIRHFKNRRIVSDDVLEKHHHCVRSLHLTSMMKLPTVIIKVVRNVSDIFAFFEDVRCGDHRAILGLVKRPRPHGFL